MCSAASELSTDILSSSSLLLRGGAMYMCAQLLVKGGTVCSAAREEGSLYVQLLVKGRAVYLRVCSSSWLISIRL